MMLAIAARIAMMIPPAMLYEKYHIAKTQNKMLRIRVALLSLAKL